MKETLLMLKFTALIKMQFRHSHYLFHIKWASGGFTSPTSIPVYTGIKCIVKDFFFCLCLNRETLLIREGQVKQSVKVLGPCVQTGRELWGILLLRTEMEERFKDL